MNDDEDSRCCAQAQQNESPIVVRVIRIEDQQRALVREHRLRRFERDAVLPDVRARFLGIPLEPELLPPSLQSVHNV